MKQLIDHQWLFRKDDGSFSDFESAPARPLDLPHDWCIEEAAFAKENYIPSVREEGHLEFRHDSFLPRGWGMYRKTLEIPRLFADQKIFLEFEGVFGESTLFVDGVKAGENSSGYAGIVYDITPFAAGKTSVTLELHVSAERMQGWWYEGGGIYRHVWLIVKPASHLQLWGTAITTPEITAESARVDVEIEFSNTTSESTLQLEIAAPDGTIAATAVKKPGAAESGKATFSLTVNAPQLWDVESPFLYTAKITLAEGNTADSENIPFGIRYFEFTPDKGFFLNGRHLQLRGGNIHHDFGGLGTALPDRAHEKNVEVLKEMGSNMIRSSHNPAAPALMEACDRMGMLLWAETRLLHPEKGAEKDLTALIRRDRNHPSIVLWSLANTAGGQNGNPVLTRKLKQLHDLARSLDPSRPTAVGLEGNADANANGFADTVDVVGYNGGGMGIDVRDHADYPDRCMVISEYASGRGARGVYQEEELGDTGMFEILGDGRKMALNGKYCSELSLLKVHAREWEHVMANPFLAGGLMWSAIEYRGETCGYPVVTSQFGVLDLCRFPKDSYYYYKMLWTKDPVLHIFPPWNRNVPEGTPVELYCCSNCDTVTLELNGKVIKEDLPLEKEKCAQWELPYAPGTLVAIGKKDGCEICRTALVTPGKAANLKITADRETINACTGDLSFLRIDVTDQDGSFVPDAAVDLEVTVSGAGILKGLCSGDPASHERENTPFIRTFSGSALAIIQSTAAKGACTVTVKGKGVAPAQMLLEVR